MESNINHKIPLIDLENLFIHRLDPNDPKIVRIAKEFGKALHEFGFAYVSHHGMPEEMIDKGFAVSKKHFKLAPSTKDKYLKKDALTNYHGYSRPGMELLNKESGFEWRESYDLIQLNRYYPTEEVPEFQEILESLEVACRSLMRKLVQLLAIALDLKDVDFFCKVESNLDDLTVDSTNTLRTLYYPPIPEDFVSGCNGKTIRRCAEHTDWGILTMLFQDSIGGLEIHGPNGEWIDVKPIPGTIVINTGDLVEACTGKYFQATIILMTTCDSRDRIFHYKKRFAVPIP